MNERDFARNPLVRDFLNWAGTLWPESPESETTGRLAGLQVRLCVAPSRFVPQGIDSTNSFGLLPMSYVWRAPGMAFGDIGETSRLLDQFSQALQAAVKLKDAKATLQVCSDIFEWGGMRNDAVGAAPLLAGKGEELPNYLVECADLLRLNSADLDAGGDATGIAHMNSMLTKVHACMATDGLPIYDSRVAGAMATIVETWRIERDLQHTPIPCELRFPAVPNGSRRGVRARYPSARSPRFLAYGGVATPQEWAGAKVRLGWLMRCLLGNPADPRMMRAFEAALFMAGYDCAGINRPQDVDDRVL